MLATKVTYAGGHSSFFSANSGSFSDTQDLECVSEPTNSPAIVDVEEICVGVRADAIGKEFLFIA